MSFRYKRNVPSQINLSLKRREVNAAFISSVESKKCRCTNLGIIANKKVHSVLLLKGNHANDPASATSNHLTKVLGLKGQVLIGDNALQYHLSGKPAMDLAEEWNKKTKLPFVFARLCYNRYGDKIEKLSNKFAASNVKIPQYILKKESKKRDITPKELLWYLGHIEYVIDHKAKKSLNIFLKAKV